MEPKKLEVKFARAATVGDLMKALATVDPDREISISCPNSTEILDRVGFDEHSQDGEDHKWINFITTSPIR